MFLRPILSTLAVLALGVATIAPAGLFASTGAGDTSTMCFACWSKTPF